MMRFSLLVLVIGLAGCSVSQPTTLETASSLFRTAEWDAAIALCDELIKSEPQNAEVWLLRGRCYMGKEMPEQAARDFSVAMGLAPEDPEPFYHRAIANRRMGKEELAANDHRAARALDIEVKKASAMMHSPFSDPRALDGIVGADQDTGQTRKQRDVDHDPTKDDAESALNDPTLGLVGLKDPPARAGLETLGDSARDSIAQTRDAGRPSAPSASNLRGRRMTGIEPPFQGSRLGPSDQSDDMGTQRVPSSTGDRRLGAAGRFPMLANAGAGPAHAEAGDEQESRDTDGESQESDSRGTSEGEDGDAEPDSDDSDPEPSSRRPVRPSGTMGLSNGVGRFTPRTGYVPPPDAQAPYRSGSYLRRMYSVSRPESGIPGSAIGPTSSLGIGQIGVGTPHMGTGLSPIGSTPVHGMGGGPIGLGPQLSGQHAVVTGPRLATEGTTSSSGTGRMPPRPAPPLRVPFQPSSDLPTTGVVRSYDGGM